LEAAFAGNPVHDLERTVSEVAAPVGPAGASAAISSDAEVEFWRYIKDSADPKDFELYLEQFPGGLYAKLAERKIAKGVSPESTRPPVVAAHEENLQAPQTSGISRIFAALGALTVLAAGIATWVYTSPGTNSRTENAQAIVQR
jgi:hypothetical protein